MSRQNPRSGFVLVTVLWTIALISALAMAASTTFRGFAGIVALDRDRVLAQALLHAGLESAAAAVANLGEKKAPTDRTITISLSTGSVQFDLSDEGGRIDINKAPVKVLASLMRSAGAGKNADNIAKAIDNWRGQDGGDQAAGTSKLPNASPPNPPAGQAAGSPPQADSSASANDGLQSFTDIRQLAQIPGMEPAYIAAITPLATVFGTDQVNALTASSEVLGALPNMSPQQISGLLNARNQASTPMERMQQFLSSVQDFTTLQARPVARVDITARLANGYTAMAQAVIVIVPHDKLPYRVLSWTPVPPATRRGSILADRY